MRPEGELHPQREGTMPMITGNFEAHSAKLVSDIRKLARMQ